MSLTNESDKSKLARFADCVVIVDNEHTDELNRRNGKDKRKMYE